MTDTPPKNPLWPWVKITDLARERGLKAQGLRKQLTRLNDYVGGKLLAKFREAPNSPLYVNVRALETFGGPHAKQQEAALKDVTIRLGEVEVKQVGHAKRLLRLEQAVNPTESK